MTFPARQQPSLHHPPGERFGLVRVIGPAPSRGRGRRWLIRCECGNERVVDGFSLRQRPPRTHRRCKA
jgi:hypothetical protein